jgi:hypothetical protein
VCWFPVTWSEYKVQQAKGKELVIFRGRDGKYL